MRMYKGIVLLAAAVFAVGCFGTSKEKKSFTPNQTQKDSAKSITTSALELQKVKTGGADAGLQGVMTIYSSSNSLASSRLGSSIGGLLVEAGKADSLGACAATSAGVTTFSNCAYGSGTLNGTITAQGQVFIVDLTITASTSGTTVKNTYKGNVTVTDTSIAGSFDFTVQASSVTYDVSVAYNSVVMTAGCPTGGSIDVSVDVSALGVSSGSGDVSVTFGPNCGDYAMIGT